MLDTPTNTTFCGRESGCVPGSPDRAPRATSKPERRCSNPTAATSGLRAVLLQHMRLMTTSGVGPRAWIPGLVTREPGSFCRPNNQEFCELLPSGNGVALKRREKGRIIQEMKARDEVALDENVEDEIASPPLNPFFIGVCQASSPFGSL